MRLRRNSRSWCEGSQGCQPRHCEECKRRSNPVFLLNQWMLRGARHRARIRATRWLAMTWKYQSARRHHVRVNPATRNRRFPDPVAVIARQHDRITPGVDAADDADVSAATPSHHGYGADLRSGQALAIACERARQIRASAAIT